MRPASGGDCGRDHDNTGFAPRLGFAFQVTEKTVIRSGLGIFYGAPDASSHDGSGRFYHQPPAFNEISFPTDNLLQPALIVKDGFPTGLIPATVVQENSAVRPAYRFIPSQYALEWFADAQRECLGRTVLMLSCFGAGALNDGAGDAGVRDTYNLRVNRGNSAYAVRHNFFLGGLRDLPFGKGRRWLNVPGAADSLLGGWQIGAFLALRSGRPFTPTVSTDLSNTGTTNYPTALAAERQRLSPGRDRCDASAGARRAYPPPTANAWPSKIGRGLEPPASHHTPASVFSATGRNA